MPKTIPAHWQTSVDITVPFYDVDAMEIAWHGNYVKYFEVARCKLLDQLQVNYFQMRDCGYGWPIVDIQLKYVRPAIFNQRIRVQVKIEEWELRLKLRYVITDIETGEVLTKGYTVQVAIDITNREMCYATPEVFRQRIGANAE
ncbi:acyl-CoA thioesterase [Teredinibacter sp. KSP-S5-2]|uniref:acyl-CoA thioesterase n=1 Tax=Teredinibacter sp. KSP-S5-2 TaxID=3034506 RepID=UPI0039777FA8